ncbi:uncharacterized protein LOC135464456 [Liolophura sinensis]|uniref:uncharacterized protein LOC135464456 n=1 Tax=Liolophura sinensis TaxID=3198878 RepID=UPI003158FDCF
MTSSLFLSACFLAFTSSYGHLVPYQPGPYVSPPVPTANEPPNTAITLPCFSNGISPGECPAPGRIIEASVLRQTSGNCRVYTTFGFVGNYLWVRQGCGGQFTVRYATNELSPNFNYNYQQSQGNYNNNNQVPDARGCPYYNTQLSCASVNNGYNMCQIPYEIVRVDVKQPYSSSACQFASSYGRTEKGKIWVSNGCSAKFDVTFKVCHGSGDSNCKVSSTLMDCRANRGYSDVTECEVPFKINSVQLQNRPTAALCNMPQSYGQARNGVWVNNGCYGTFDIIGMNHLFVFALVASTLFESTIAQPRNLQQGEVTCTALFNNQPNQCLAPGRIVEAWVARQQNSGKCRVYSTFGFIENYLWVRNGCGGTFAIVYEPQQYLPNTQPTTNPSCQQGEINVFCSHTTPRATVCGVLVLVTHVNFRQQYNIRTVANSACQENYGYGISQNQSAIWTNRGCQGTFDVDFQICPKTSPMGCRSYQTSLQCGSGGFISRECGVPVEVTGIRLIPSILPINNLCVENVSYGRVPEGVWVSEGCRGSFTLSYRVCTGYQGQVLG